MTYKEARLCAGMTCAEAAVKIGVSRQMIYRWESGKGKPGAHNIENVAAAYNLTPLEVTRLEANR